MALSFKQKIIASMMLCGLVPMLSISAFLLYGSYQTSFKDGGTVIETLHDQTIDIVKDYFDITHKQTSERANANITRNALKDFTAAVEALDVSAIKVDDAKLRERYVYQQQKSKGTQASDVDSWIPTDPKVRALQHLYISANNDAIGHKNELQNPGDGSQYSAVHEKYHKFFKRFVEDYGYYDMFLVDAKSGRVVYTDFKEVDFMSSVNEGPLVNTEFSKVVRKAMQMNDDRAVVMSDFLPYMPSYNDAAGFLAAPIIDEGKVIGVFALQMPMDKISAAFDFAAGIAKTSDAFLVGEDMKFRSKPHKIDANIYDDVPAGLAEHLNKVFKENFDGLDEWAGADGEVLYGAMQKIDLGGVQWAVVVLQAKSELLSEFHDQLWFSIIVVGITVLVVIGAGFWISKGLTAPVIGIAKSFFTGAERVAASTSQVSEAVSSMVAASEETSAQSKVVRKNSSEAAGYVSSVSSAVSELNVSINDISQSIGETNVLIDDAVTKAKKTDEVVRSLGEASKKITEVVSLINDLAEQTNLLALNAAIEAARAGDAGRGFAVVADEVKKLASHTSQATVDIGEQVKEIQEVSEESVVALQTVVEAIHKIRDNATTVSAAVEEQSGVAKQIAGSVLDAASRVQQVDENMNGIEQAANDTGVAADQVNGSAQEVQSAFGEMKGQVQKVLDDMGIKA